MRSDDIRADRKTDSGALTRRSNLPGVVLYTVVALCRDDGVLLCRHLCASRDLRLGISRQFVDGDRAGHSTAISCPCNAHADVEEIQIARRIREDVRRVYLPSADRGDGVGLEEIDGNARTDGNAISCARSDDGECPPGQFAIRRDTDIAGGLIRRLCLDVGAGNLCRCVLLDVRNGDRPCKRSRTARGSDVERDGVQLALVFGVHIHCTALCKSDFRPADACAILLFLQSVVGDGAAHRAALRRGGYSADGGILPRLVERCHGDGFCPADLSFVLLLVLLLMLCDLCAGVVLSHVDGDATADHRVRPCRNACRQCLDAADVLRVEVYDAVLRECQLAAAQRRRRIIVQHVDGGGKPCRNACAARGDADLPRDVDEEGLGDCVRVHLLCLDGAVLNECRCVVLRDDDGGRAGDRRAAAARRTDRHIDGAGVGDALDGKPVCALDVQIAALYPCGKVIFNHADTDAKPRSRLRTAAHRSGDACRRRDDGAAAALRQIAILIYRQRAVALALCKILLIAVPRGGNAALFEVVLVFARRVFVIRTDACAVCCQCDVRELRRRLVREVVDGEAARQRRRAAGAGRSAHADRCADLGHAGDGLVRQCPDVTQRPRVALRLRDLRTHIVLEVGHGDDCAHRVCTLTARSDIGTRTARYLRIRADGAIGDIRFLRVRKRTAVRVCIDEIIPHPRRRDGATLVIGEGERYRNARTRPRAFDCGKPECCGSGRALLHGGVFDTVRTFDPVLFHVCKNVTVLYGIDAERTRESDIRLALSAALPCDRHRAAPRARKGGVHCADGEVLRSRRRSRFFQRHVRADQLCRRGRLADVDGSAARRAIGKGALLCTRAAGLSCADAIDRRSGAIRLGFFGHSVLCIRLRFCYVFVGRLEQFADFTLYVVQLRAEQFLQSAARCASGTALLPALGESPRRRDSVDDALLLCLDPEILRLYRTRLFLCRRAKETLLCYLRAALSGQLIHHAFLCATDALRGTLFCRLVPCLCRIHIVIRNGSNTRLCDVVHGDGHTNCPRLTEYGRTCDVRDIRRIRRCDFCRLIRRDLRLVIDGGHGFGCAADVVHHALHGELAALTAADSEMDAVMLVHSCERDIFALDLCALGDKCTSCRRSRDDGDVAAERDIRTILPCGRTREADDVLRAACADLGRICRRDNGVLSDEDGGTVIH